MRRRIASSRGLLMLATALAGLPGLALGITSAAAQTAPALDRGDAVVTGFPGIVPSTKPPAPGSSPLDHFFIDTNGPAAQVLSLRTLGGPPQGQLAAGAAKLRVTAGQVGQVFAITLDDSRSSGSTTTPPAILLGATAAYGLHIVDPAGAGAGNPKRLRKGKAGARWMRGMWGLDAGGGPGTIWRVDGTTGAVTRFADLPGNSGPGIGDIVVDASSGQVYASDLDTGLVYRMGPDGAVIDSFDHGLAGRPARGLAPVVDDGRRADIEDAGFDVTKPDTWGFTPAERRVGGLAIRDGRLYYAVAGAPQVWSVGLAPGGGFAGDARHEFDVADLASGVAITDLLFDSEGRLVLGQRGAQRGSYDFSIYAEPGKSPVLRYARDASGTWAPVPDSYAIGTEPPHRAADGGVALGYRHDETGALRAGTCGSTLWSTGSRLRASAPPAGGGAAPLDVHGLQGHSASLVQPQNTPPTAAYFADTDQMYGDAEKAGHVGDVEVWQPCGGADFTSIPSAPGGYGFLPPGYLPPLDVPPPHDLPDPLYPYNANLELTKRATGSCFAWGAGWACRYDIRVRNTGPDAYFAPIMVRDQLPAAPAGAVMVFGGAPWACWNAGAATYDCWRPHTFLAPGTSVWLTAWAWVPNSYPQCHLQNFAGITFAPGGTARNTDIADDFDGAVAAIPAPQCPPPDGPTNLKLTKDADPEKCWKVGDGFRCRFRITVTNMGPGSYSGNLVVRDTPVLGTATTFAGAGWACAPMGLGHNCTRAEVGFAPGEQRWLFAFVDVPAGVAEAKSCKIDNTASIMLPVGGTPPNINPGDDQDSDTATIEDPICQPPVPLIQKQQLQDKEPECPAGFQMVDGSCKPRQVGLPPVIVPPVTRPDRPVVDRDPPRVCPKGMVGTPPNCRKPQTDDDDDDEDTRPRTCPKGMVGTPPNCRQPQTNDDPPRVCPKGMIGTPPNCRKPPRDDDDDDTPSRACPKGMIGTPPNCRKPETSTPPVRVCPPGMIGTPPNCKPRGSSSGQGGSGSTTRPRTCPSGMIGSPPNCRPLTIRAIPRLQVPERLITPRRPAPQQTVPIKPSQGPAIR